MDNYRKIIKMTEDFRAPNSLQKKVGPFFIELQRLVESEENAKIGAAFEYNECIRFLINKSSFEAVAKCAEKHGFKMEIN